MQVGPFPGGEIIDAPHLLAASQQSTNKIRANEAGSAGHEIK
jgi:hypothetical protein